MSVRLLHTADWQLGKPFGNVPGDAGSALRAQRVATVARLADLAREREVDAVLVAGDAFDSNQVHDRTLFQTLGALQGFAGAWIFLPGNHDAALSHSVWTRLRAKAPPSNVTIADRAEPIELRGRQTTILPAPLRRHREVLDQTEWFDRAATPDDTIRVGLAHGSVAGRLPERAEASNAIDPDRARRAGLGYLALGDWHGALQIGPQTWYSGTPETDRHRSNDSGLAHVVTIAGPGAPAEVEAVRVGHYRWQRLDIELVDGTADRAVLALRDLEPEAARAVVALRLTGSISLGERHRLDREIDHWQARLHHLDVDLSGLRDEPTADDLDAIDTGGFVRLAIERLKAQAADPLHPDSGDARVALRMLYLDHLKQR